MGSMRRSASGNALLTTMAGTVVAFLLGVFFVDTGYYFTQHNQLVTAAESAALAGTQALMLTSDKRPSVLQSNAEELATEYGEANTTLTHVEPSDITLGSYDFTSQTFTPLSSSKGYQYRNGYNAVQVRVMVDSQHDSGELPSIMGKLVDIDSYESGARATAAFSDQIAQVRGGLRPIYGCQSQFDNAMGDGNPANNVIRIYGDKFMLDGSTQTCPTPTAGNWGFADLRDCNAGSVGASTIGDWFLNGYSGIVEAGKCYSTKPGNFISSGPTSSALDKLISDKTIITIPLASKFNGTGSNTNVTVSGFAGFVIQKYVANGNAANRYIEGYYTMASCRPGSVCKTGASKPGGIVKLQLVKSQQDEA